MKRIALLGLAAAGLLGAAETLEVFGRQWTVPAAADWALQHENGGQTLRLVRERGPLPGPTRPIEFALAKPDLQSATVEADVRAFGRSVIIVYDYHDPEHFNYAHISKDTAAKQPHHNGIFHVYGGERVRISSEDGPAALPEGTDWQHVRLWFDGNSGEVRVEVNGTAVTALHAIDLSLRGGRVGIGSFDETGEFKNVKITEAAPAGH